MTATRPITFYTSNHDQPLGWTGHVVDQWERDREELARQGRAGMAPDRLMPCPHLRPHSGVPITPYAFRLLQQNVLALQFLQAYLAFVDDEGREAPTADFEPQRVGESDQEAADRLRAAMLEQSLRDIEGTRADNARDILALISPTDASPVVSTVREAGPKYLRIPEDRHPDLQEWGAGTCKLLAAICPPEHWITALDVLELRLSVYGTDGRHAPDWNRLWSKLLVTLHFEPAPVIHVEAAVVAFQLGRRDLVPDPRLPQWEIAEWVAESAEFVHSPELRTYGEMSEQEYAEHRCSDHS